LSAPKLVLDTNVALDLFHWNDRTAAPILQAVQAGRCELLTDAACFAEFAHVIARPQFGLAAAAAAAAIDAYRQIVRPHASPATNPAHSLPRCRDPDDQKFLELARASGADLLVTRDKALLTLSRRKHALAGFRIVAPVGATGATAGAGSGANATGAASGLPRWRGRDS
jgi:putative PIN family toxin of toxin-antitoxin system